VTDLDWYVNISGDGGVCYTLRPGVREDKKKTKGCRLRKCTDLWVTNVLADLVLQSSKTGLGRFSYYLDISNIQLTG
jgi:hypothetical protein